MKKEFSVKRGADVKTITFSAIENYLPYEIVKADPSIDIWAFGVLLYTMCTCETIFKVNRDDDITDGDALKKLEEWNSFHLSVPDPEAEALLQKLLRKDPTARSNIDEVLYDDYFHPERRSKNDTEIIGAIRSEGEKTRTAIKTDGEQTRDIVREEGRKLMEVQTKTNRMMRSLLDKICPRHVILLPSSKSSFEFKNLFEDSVQLCFVCPILMEVPKDGDGNFIGYTLKNPKEWVKKYGPGLLLTWKIARVIAAGLGVKMPSPKNLENLNFDNDQIDIVSRMEKETVLILGGTATQNLPSLLRDKLQKKFESIVNSDGSIPDEYKDETLRNALKSFDGMVDGLDDPEFSISGLKKVTSEDGSTEFVHPSIADVYREFGEKCFDFDESSVQKRIQEIEKDRIRLDMERKDELNEENMSRIVEEGWLYERIWW